MQLWPKSQTRRALAVAALILTAVAVVSVIFLANWSDRSTLQEWANIVQSIVVVLAIIVGGIFALFKLQAFRDFDPHLTITHKVTHRPIGDSYVHIDITAKLLNSSKVQVEIREGFFSLQRISPTTDTEIEGLFEEMVVRKEKRSLQWPTLYELRSDWDKGELTVEPGESHYESTEFIVSSDIESVIMYTYFSNPRFPLSSATPKGWAASTVYDISQNN